MNGKLNRRGSPLPHLIIPQTGAVSPISSSSSSANKLDSTLLVRCLRGGSPSPSSAAGKVLRRSPLESIRYASTAVKVVDDEVLVMDGILVACGSPSSSSSGGGSGPRKCELCRSWEDLGHCRYGSKCQFAHGKEEIRPSCLSVKKKTEASTCKSYSTGSPLHGLKCRSPLMVMTEGAGAASQKSTLRSPSDSRGSPNISVKSDCSSKKTSLTDNHDSSGRNQVSNVSNHSKSIPTVDMRSPDFGKLDANTTRVECWSPIDDGIEVTLPDQIGIFASREDVHAHINSVLYGPPTRKRLPVFTVYRE